MVETNFKGIKKRIQLSEGAKEIFFEVLLFAACFALMPVRFLFGTYPFGIALVGSTKKKMPFALAGAVLSVVFLMDASIPYLVALVALTGLRMSASFIKKTDYKKTELGATNGKRIADILFNEGIELRVVVTALVTLGIGIYTVIYNGYLYYDVFVLIFNTVFVSIMTYCLCGLFEDKEKKSFLFGACALLFCIIYFLSGKELGGIDFTIALSYGTVLYISKNYGGVKGAALGLLLGCAQGGVLSAVLGICGIVSGFLWSLSPYLAIMSSFILSLGYAISILGYEAVIYLTPEILAASLIMYPLLRFEVLPKPIVINKEQDKGMVVYHLENRSNEIKERVSSLSQAFSNVSKSLKKVSQRTKNPDKRGYLDMALEICEGHCCVCPKNNICWSRDINTTENNINRMGEALFIRKQVKKGDVEEKFLHRCPNIDKIMEELNAKNKEVLAQSVKNDKLDVCAQDYESVSKMMDSIFKKDMEISVDRELTDKAIRASAKCGLVCEKIEVVGQGLKRVIATGVDIQRSKCTALELRHEMEKCLCMSLKEPVITEEDGYATLKIEGENKFKVDISAKSYTKDDGEINGDSSLCFENGSKQYMIICDGMGSGRQAQLTSQLCIDLLNKMLSVTSEKELVLSMLNNLIRAKNVECSSTVDIFELDLINGEGSFIKSGACPSFVKRGENVFKLQSKTAPIGIMKSLDAEELSCTFNKGDICVMVSDGVVPSKQDSRWIMQYLTDFKGDDPKELSQGIMQEARRRGTRDDMTVLAMVIN